MFIVLGDGTTIEGEAASPGSAKCEAVFTTAYSGYEESITDPSYNGQALIFTYPQIGNYGLDGRRFESGEIQPNAVIAREFMPVVRRWLRQNDVPAVEAVDTRAIVKKIREKGSMPCGIASSQSGAERLCAEVEFDGIDMTYSPPENLPERYGDGRPIIVMLDCGVKNSMIEQFVDRGAQVVRLPWNVNPHEIGKYDPDLLFVSNGPGDPKEYLKAVSTIQLWGREVPVAGICLGQQLITLALGGDTEKMKFGHRGVNQPVYSNDFDNVFMSSQNHSHHVSVVPDELEVVEYNVNDDSPEGLRGDGIRTVQWHPEANPGPHDSHYFFDEVLGMI